MDTNNPYASPESPIPATEDQPPQRTARPFGIWLIAGLHLLAGVGILCAMIIAFASLSELDSDLLRLWVVAVPLAFGTTWIATGIALWLGSPWGWWPTALLYVWQPINMATAAVWSALSGGETGGDEETAAFSRATNAGVSVLFLLYLLTPKVRAFCGLKSMSARKATLILLAIGLLCAVVFEVILSFVSNAR